MIKITYFQFKSYYINTSRVTNVFNSVNVIICKIINLKYTKYGNKNGKYKTIGNDNTYKASHTNGFKILANLTQYCLCKIHFFSVYFIKVST
jgi:hypothetical protein